MLNNAGQKLERSIFNSAHMQMPPKKNNQNPSRGTIVMGVENFD